MKNRLTGKPASIAILAVLFILSLADVILRGIVLQESALSAPYMGEPFVTIVFSVLLIIFALKGKDRLFYILCGAFLAHFVLNQLFDLPTIVANFVSMFNIMGGISTATIMIPLHAVSIISIIAIGGLLVEYMNDGSIYNKAFNILCIISIIAMLLIVFIGIYDLILGAHLNVLFRIFNNLSRISMIFLFATFAYDTAKEQLAKTKL